MTGRCKNKKTETRANAEQVIFTHSCITMSIADSVYYCQQRDN